jgi:ATP synthase protein I
MSEREPASDPFQRKDIRERTQRDLRRLRRKEPEGHFWRSLALLGSVGWSIVLFALGGLLLGRYLDARLDWGVGLTLLLLTAGTGFGTWVAFRHLRAGGRR